MTECYQKARELGELILKSEEAIHLADAAAVYGKSKASLEKMDKYVKFRESIQEKARNQAYSEGEYAKESQELADMGEELKKDLIIGAMIFAETEFNGFVNSIINVLRATITGEAEPEDCSSCGGDCGHCH